MTRRAHLIWSEKLFYNFTLALVGKVWKSLVTIFSFGICPSFLDFPFFLWFKFVSLHLLKFLLVPWTTPYSSDLEVAVAITLVA